MKKNLLFCFICALSLFGCQTELNSGQREKLSQELKDSQKEFNNLEDRFQAIVVEKDSILRYILDTNILARRRFVQEDSLFALNLGNINHSFRDQFSSTLKSIKSLGAIISEHRQSLRSTDWQESSEEKRAYLSFHTEKSGSCNKQLSLTEAILIEYKNLKSQLSLVGNVPSPIRRRAVLPSIRQPETTTDSSS